MKRNVAYIAGATAFVLLLVYGFNILLLGLAGFLAAILLIEAAAWLEKRTRLNYEPAFFVVLVLLLTSIVIVTTLCAPSIEKELVTLWERLDLSIASLKKRLGRYDWIGGYFDLNKLSLASGKDVLSVLGGVFSSGFGALGSLLIIALLGLYFAADPQCYRQGLLSYIPTSRQKQVEAVLASIYSSLKRVIAGRLISMCFVGVVSAVGLWLLGIPLAVPLGILAALLGFIPNIGPALAVIPPALLALEQGTSLALYVVIFYTLLQAVESYGLTPMIQQHQVAIPPATLLVAQLYFGVFAGVLGLALALPAVALLKAAIDEIMFISANQGHVERARK